MDTTRQIVLPMFPLPDFFLFPGSLVPLYVFEKRYRQMINDQLDRVGRLVMASIPSRHRQKDGSPPTVFPIGALGEIIHHEPLPEGKYLIWLLGLGRVRLAEVPSDRLYRRVAIEVLEEEECNRTEADGLRSLLLDALKQRQAKMSEGAEDLPVGVMADLLLQNMKLPAVHLERAFGEPSERERAKLALRWHPVFPDEG
jgi:Lon protease-like protein